MDVPFRLYRLEPFFFRGGIAGGEGVLGWCTLFRACLLDEQPEALPLDLTFDLPLNCYCCIVAD